MKTIRKQVALILAAVMLVLMTACTGSNDKPKGRSGAVKEPTGTPAAESGTKELTKTSSGEAPDPGKLAQTFERAEDYRKGIRSFAAKLLLGSYKGETVMVSPISVYAALGMLANGAEGETLKEMETMFGCSADTLNQVICYMNQCSKDSDVVRMANSIWLNSDWDFNVPDEFLKTCGTYYQSSVMKAPFRNPQTLKDINDWVKTNTKNRIDSILDSLSDDEVMVLINAITFDGVWEEPFTEDATKKDADFHRADGTIKKVDLMSGEADRYFEDDDMTGFEKWYKNGYYFRAYLPKDGKTVSDIAKKLATVSEIPYQNASEIYVKIPKFKEESTIGLNDILAGLGMKKAFTSDAEFARLADIPVNISKVIQKTYIKMDEHGTEAAAVTAITIEANCYNTETIIRSVTLDHPFVYEIIDSKSDTPLFIGIYE
ncbi:MAG: serpin family protein [Lachnospiraceae bacterium]|nr:serpin family protein [Lachnospiraceae bacterium]